MRSDDKNYIQKGSEVDFSSDISGFFDVTPSSEAIPIGAITASRPRRSAKRTQLVRIDNLIQSSVEKQPRLNLSQLYFHHGVVLRNVSKDSFDTFLKTTSCQPNRYLE